MADPQPQLSKALFFILNSLLVSAFAFSWPVLAREKGSANNDHPNEIQDSAGRFKGPYSVIKDSISDLSRKTKKSFADRSVEIFDGDNKLSPLPRILDRNEYKFLQEGADQRARALRAFVKDHYSGKKTYLRAGVIPAGVVERALVRSGEVGFEGQVDPEKINFLYGPDLVKARYKNQISWYVLEDNVGYLGGMGDLILAHKMITDLHPGLYEKFDLNNPLNFYLDFSRVLSQQAAANGGIPVVYHSPGPTTDNESERVLKIMSTLGITEASEASGNRLAVENGRVYIYIKGRNGNVLREKVGALYVNDELSWVDRTYRPMHDKHIIEIAGQFISSEYFSSNLKDEVVQTLSKINPETGLPSISKLKRIMIDAGFHMPIRSYVPGLIDSILKGHVTSTSYPGTDFLSDKEISIYVENMIRHYLSEEPLLQHPPTEAFVDPKSGAVKQDLIENVLANIENWVVKRFDGRGGKGVWVGSKLNAGDLKELRKLLQLSPESFMAQATVKMSRLGDDITDARIHLYVSPERVLVSDVPWGRGAPLNGDGKVNISSKGHEVAVIVASKKKTCDRLLRGKP